ncbi:unnamed protein product [Paramecium sonneborni]|uniref:Uncharacterized protein n=1 Tax=Paramecium sonneborni TaxID=65129 RepID=A0A8S1M1X6_9CILI|nr:unnamed protein product [Paramecium sonneborni]
MRFTFVIQFIMKIKKLKNKRSKYKSINSNERALIIQYIEEYKYSTSHVSMITGHNKSTIKAIYQVYKKEGRVYKKEKRDRILNITAQVLLFVVDDLNESFVRLGEEFKDFKTVNEEDSDIIDFKEQLIKEQLINKKCQILSLLVNQQAENNFTEEMNTIIEQQSLTNDFRIFQERQSIKVSINRKQEKCSYINQIPKFFYQNFYSSVLNILDEQHRLMRS